MFYVPLFYVDYGEQLGPEPVWSLLSWSSCLLDDLVELTCPKLRARITCTLSAGVAVHEVEACRALLSCLAVFLTPLTAVCKDNDTHAEFWWIRKFVNLHRFRLFVMPLLLPRTWEATEACTCITISLLCIINAQTTPVWPDVDAACSGPGKYALVTQYSVFHAVLHILKTLVRVVYYTS